MSAFTGGDITHDRNWLALGNATTSVVILSAVQQMGARGQVFEMGFKINRNHRARVSVVASSLGRRPHKSNLPQPRSLLALPRLSLRIDASTSHPQWIPAVNSASLGARALVMAKCASRQRASRGPAAAAFTRSLLQPSQHHETPARRALAHVIRIQHDFTSVAAWFQPDQIGVRQSRSSKNSC